MPDLEDHRESESDNELPSTEELRRNWPEKFAGNKDIVEWLEKRIQAQDREVTRRLNMISDQQNNIIEVMQHSIRSAVSEEIARQIAPLSKDLENINQRLHSLETRRQETPFDLDVMRETKRRLHRLDQSPRNNPRLYDSDPMRLSGNNPQILPQPFRNGAPSPPSPPDRQYDRDQTRREATFDIGSGSNGRLGSLIKIKREDIGQFNPHHDDPDDLGIVTDGKSAIYTDVHCFLDCIETFLEDPETRPEMERQIAQLLPTLLGGNALLWWTNEVTPDCRNQLRRTGLKYVLEDLRVRFDIDPGTATRRFNQGSLSLKDIARDESVLS
ncbi:hypothetical protein MMYC01_205668, partial [Madurella mycetomatis]